MESIKQKLIDLGFKFDDSYSTGSSYLLNDGTFLNLKDCKNYSFPFHGSFDKFIIRKNIISEEDVHLLNDIKGKTGKPWYVPWGYERVLRYTDNAIAMNDGEYRKFDNCFVDLPPNEISNKQIEKLTLMLDALHYNNVSKRKLDVGLDDNLMTFNLDEDSTDDIIKAIKKLYNTLKE